MGPVVDNYDINFKIFNLFPQIEQEGEKDADSSESH